MVVEFFVVFLCLDAFSTFLWSDSFEKRLEAGILQNYKAKKLGNIGNGYHFVK